MGERVVGIASRQVRPFVAALTPADPRLRTLLDLSRDAFVETDANGTVTEWNRQAEILFGWSRHEVLGRCVAQFFVPERHAPSLMAELASLPHQPRAERTSPRRLTVRHREGHEMDVTTTAYIVGQHDDVRIGGFMHEASEEEESAEQALAHAYLHDTLTGLPNRTLFTYRLAYALARMQALDVVVAVLDLDRFKAVNDALGHEVGDEVLVEVAKRLTSTGTCPDVVARLGGDEFLALFEGEQAQETALHFAQQALEALEEPMAVGPSEIFLTASIGIASSAAGECEPTPLLSNADAAMHRAKERGGRRVEVFGEALRLHVVDRMSTEHALHRALERAELTLHYQPVIDMRDDRPVATEALIRWAHPDHGVVGPDKFVPIAEESGLIIPIGRWVLREACTQLTRWQSEGRVGPFGAVEVNLSARQVDHPDILKVVSDALVESGVAPEHVVLEITESALMHDPRAALRVLSGFKDLGVTLAVDDFGTGYSSLSYLQRFPLDVLKVDRSFVADLGTGGDASQIVAAVIGLAHSLGLLVVAEGVETAGQLQELRRFGCDFAQGFLFSRPVPAHLVGEPAPLVHSPVSGIAAS